MAKKQTVKKVKRSKRQPNVEFAVNGCLVTMTYSEWEKQCQKWKEKLVSYIKDIPVVPVTNFFNYSLMLHYCVNSEYLNPSAIPLHLLFE